MNHAQLGIHASQENGRVHSWGLSYVKGVTVTRHPLDSETYNAGVFNVGAEGNVDANVMLLDPASPTGKLQSTCAFALVLSAHSHVIGNWGFQYYAQIAGGKALLLD